MSMPTVPCPKCGRAIMAGQMKLQKKDQPSETITFLERHMQAEHGPDSGKRKRARGLGVLLGRQL